MMEDFYGLRGKNVLITGSSRGIGAATARVYISHGANVILHGRTDSSKLINLASELNSKYIFCDVGDIRQVEEKVSTLKNTIDILVNNAGINISKPFGELETEDWRKVWSTNVLGTVNFSKTVIPGMQERGYGRIINIASIKGDRTYAGSSAYASSKAAIMNLTASMANQYAPAILVNCVAPGFIETEMTKATWTDRIAKQVDGILLKRMASSSEIADAIVFLSSNRANYITGQTLMVDGGLTIKN